MVYFRMEENRIPDFSWQSTGSTVQKGGNEVYERTDYPWVYSYGDKSIEDFQNLEKGALVFIDGALQARKFKEQYVCGTCGQEYDVRGRTLEVLSYDTEYLRLPNPINKGEDEEDNDSEE